jgi:hypothetical protein
VPVRGGANDGIARDEEDPVRRFVDEPDDDCGMEFWFWRPEVIPDNKPGFDEKDDREGSAGTLGETFEEREEEDVPRGGGAV